MYNNTISSGTSRLLFTFTDFKLSSISIKNEFNNFYKDINDYCYKMSIFLGRALPLLAAEDETIFSDKSKSNVLHLHKLNGKEKILEKILTEYNFSQLRISNILEGEIVYQLEVPYLNGATRIIFERVGNEVSFLFMDNNHHIYMNKDKIKQSGSMFYKYCPININGNCMRMNYFHTCFASDFLDYEKYEATFNNLFSII